MRAHAFAAIAALMIVAVLEAGPARAGSVLLYNTGVDAFGQILRAGSADPHWTVPGPFASTGSAVVLAAGDLPGAWTVDGAVGSPGSAWIGLVGGDLAPAYSLILRQVFTVTAPSATRIAGVWSVDDAGILSVNGHVIETGKDLFKGEDFAVPIADLVIGANSFMASVAPDGRILGLRIEFTDEVATAPLPAALPMFGAAVVGLAGMALRKRRRAGMTRRA